MQAFDAHFANESPNAILKYETHHVSSFILLLALVNAMRAGHVFSSAAEWTPFSRLVELRIEDAERALSAIKDSRKTFT
jgi:hypothetical protein